MFRKFPQVSYGMKTLIDMGIVCWLACIRLAIICPHMGPKNVKTKNNFIQELSLKLQKEKKFINLKCHYQS